MTPQEALQHHLSLCDEIYQLALEENRFLKQQQRTPETALLDRKRALLARLDESLAALRSQAPAPSESRRPDPARKDVLEKARAKILQILHLDRENEQLLLRYSLSPRPRPAAAPSAEPAAPAAPTTFSHLQRLYDRHG